MLGIPADADVAQVKHAYKVLSRKHHPDRGGDPRIFMEVSNAREKLMDALMEEEF